MFSFTRKSRQRVNPAPQVADPAAVVDDGLPCIDCGTKVHPDRRVRYAAGWVCVECIERAAYARAQDDARRAA